MFLAADNTERAYIYKYSDMYHVPICRCGSAESQSKSKWNVFII